MTASPDQTTAEHGRIVVSGTGRVLATPDIADLRLGIALSRPTVALARADAAAIQTAVLDAVRAVGVEPRDVRTSDLSLHPRYDHTGTGAVNGYELSNQVEVTIRELARVGEVVDGALAAGATSMHGLSFRLDDPGPAETEARRQAVAAARAAAGTLAESAGLVLGEAIEIVEGGGGPGLPRPFAAKAERMLAADISTPVEGGSSEVTVTVTVTYAVRPAG